LEKDAAVVREAKADGGRVQRGGLFFQPTTVGDLPPTARSIRRDVLGPVLAMAKFRGEDEVLSLADDSGFGLAARAWMRDIKRGHRTARKPRASRVGPNTYRALALKWPFDGDVANGIGRDDGQGATHDFMQVKSVWCELGGEIRDSFVLKT
jgi:aldehyde dehydrogenase (NAD+)